jgi:hypothetical protein
MGLPALGLTAYWKAQVDRDNALQATVETIISRLDAALATLRDVQDFTRRNLPVVLPPPPPDASLQKLDALTPRFDDLNTRLGRIEALLAEALTVKV